MNSYIVLVLADSIGYFLQSMGAVVGIYIASKRKIAAKNLFFMSLVFAVVAYLCIYISQYVGFGLHSMLMIAAFVAIACLWLKTNLVNNIFAVIGTFIVIAVYEAINYMVCTMLMGEGTLKTILENTDIHCRIIKTFIGYPTNIMLLVTMIVVYKIVMLKMSKKEHDSGEAGENDSGQSR